MTIATRALWRLYDGRRLLVRGVVVAAVGLFALSGARPAHAGAPPDLTVDTPTYMWLPAHSFMNNPAGSYLIVNVRNTGGSDVNQPFRVTVIAFTIGGGGVDIMKTYTMNSLAAGAGRGALIWVPGCNPGSVLAFTAYVDIDNHIDEFSELNNQRSGNQNC